MPDLSTSGIARSVQLRSVRLVVGASDPAVHGDASHGRLHLPAEVDDRDEELPGEILSDRTRAIARGEGLDLGNGEVSRLA